MAFDLNDDFKDYKASVMSKTEKLIKEEFPKRVKMLNELLKSPIFKQNPADPFIEHSHAYLHGQNEMEKLAENLESKMVFSSDATLKETMTTSTTCNPVTTTGSYAMTSSKSVSTSCSSGLTPCNPTVTPCDSKVAPFPCIPTSERPVKTPCNHVMTPDTSVVTPKSSAVTTCNPVATPKSSAVTPCNSVTTPESSAVTPCNPVATQIISLIKPKLVELSEAADDINIWFVLLTPKMEDGNNFGVEVQESVRDNIRHIFSNANTYINEMTNYHLSRGNIMKKRAKYPGIADFAQSLKMADESMVQLNPVIMDEKELNVAYVFFLQMVQ